MLSQSLARPGEWRNSNAYSAFEGGYITGPAGSYAAYKWNTSQCGSKHSHAEGPNG